MIDCTGSMETHLDATQSCIWDIVKAIKEANPCLQLWIGFVGYRDHSDGDLRLATMDFTGNTEAVRSFIAKQKAQGGGDGPGRIYVLLTSLEDVFGGLNAMLKLNWTHGTRILFHIGDYPQHGKEYSDLPDDYPKDPYGLTAEGLLDKYFNHQKK